MEPHHQYIPRFPLIMTLSISAIATVAAVTYAVSNAFLPTDVPALIDQAVQRSDINICATATTEEGRKECFSGVYASLRTANTCAKIPYTDIQAGCAAYFDKISQLKTKSEQLRKQFTYDQVNMEVGFQDGSRKTFRVLVADTDEKRVQGLSYVDVMNANEGMLFAFPSGMPAIAFHMKDMLLPLDIIFLDADMMPKQSFRNLASCAGLEKCPL